MPLHACASVGVMYGPLRVVTDRCFTLLGRNDMLCFLNSKFQVARGRPKFTCECGAMFLEYFTDHFSGPGEAVCRVCVCVCVSEH